LPDWFNVEKPIASKYVDTKRLRTKGRHLRGPKSLPMPMQWTAIAMSAWVSIRLAYELSILAELSLIILTGNAMAAVELCQRNAFAAAHGIGSTIELAFGGVEAFGLVGPVGYWPAR
jgi:hypothetical protein